MFFKKLLNTLGFVRRKVVNDHVDFSSFGLGGHQFLQKGDKLPAGMTRSGLAQHLPTARVQCGVKRKRSVAIERMPKEISG